MTKIELLWETYEFVDERITKLEAEFADLLEQSKLYCMQNFLKEVDNGTADLDAEVLTRVHELSHELQGHDSDIFSVDRDVLREQFTTVSQELDTYYGKQLTTIQDIKAYQEEHPFATIGTEGREVDDELLQSLEDITGQLKASHSSSTIKIFEMLEKEPPA